LSHAKHQHTCTQSFIQNKFFLCQFQVYAYFIGIFHTTSCRIQHTLKNNTSLFSICLMKISDYKFHYSRVSFQLISLCYMLKGLWCTGCSINNIYWHLSSKILIWRLSCSFCSLLSQFPCLYSYPTSFFFLILLSHRGCIAGSECCGSQAFPLDSRHYVAQSSGNKQAAYILRCSYQGTNL